MLEELFSPDPQILNFKKIEFDADVVVVKVISAEKVVSCPYCQMAAYRIEKNTEYTLIKIGYHISQHSKLMKFQGS